MTEQSEIRAPREPGFLPALSVSLSSASAPSGSSLLTVALSWGKSSHQQLCRGEVPPVGGQAQGAEGLGGHGNSLGRGSVVPPEHRD